MPCHIDNMNKVLAAAGGLIYAILEYGGAKKGMDKKKDILEELRIELSTSSSPTVFDSANDALYQVSYTPDLMVDRFVPAIIYLLHFH